MKQPSAQDRQEAARLKRSIALALQTELAHRMWSAEDLAQHTDIDAATIRTYVRGDKLAPLNKLTIIAKALGHPRGGVDWLIGASGEEWTSAQRTAAALMLHLEDPEMQQIGLNLLAALEKPDQELRRAKHVQTPDRSGTERTGEPNSH